MKLSATGAQGNKCFTLLREVFLLSTGGSHPVDIWGYLETCMAKGQDSSVRKRETSNGDVGLTTVKKEKGRKAG